MPEKRDHQNGCVCCGGVIWRALAIDPWAARLDDYCEDCATARCDARAGACDKGHVSNAPRIWYSPPWQLSEPWKVYVFRGGDEWGRDTLAFHFGPLGMFVVVR